MSQLVSTGLIFVSRLSEIKKSYNFLVFQSHEENMRRIYSMIRYIRSNEIL